MHILLKGLFTVTTSIRQPRRLYLDYSYRERCDFDLCQLLNRVLPLAPFSWVREKGDDP
ncbi:hypothetical protein ANRL4_00749 [Anaerolineae bacterium]|nr:hypothetical protein ANRL4_00749 [Anaerolineae bacterium]